jgi:hypothetical protein
MTAVLERRGVISLRVDADDNRGRGAGFVMVAIDAPAERGEDID